MTSKFPRLQIGAAVFAFIFRHPLRKLAVATLLGLITVGVGLASLSVWAWHHFHAAQDCLQRYHDREAREHLQAYLSVRPRDGQALLLSARVARRLGAFDEADQFLDRYLAIHGQDDDLLVERVLVRANLGEVDETRKF